MTCSHLTPKGLTPRVHRCISALLAVTLLFQSLAFLTPVYADETKDTGRFTTVEIDSDLGSIPFQNAQEAARSLGINLDDFLNAAPPEKGKKLSSEEQRQILIGRYVAENFQGILLNVARLQSALQKHGENKAQKYTSDGFKNYVVKGQLVEELRTRIENVGYAEYTGVDGRPIPKVVLIPEIPGLEKGTVQLSWFILPADFDPKSKHLAQVVSKNIIMGGYKQAGREQVYVLTEKSEEAKQAELAERLNNDPYRTADPAQDDTTPRTLDQYIAEATLKPAKYSSSWWRHYKQALFSKPTSANIRLAAFCGLLQASITCSLEGLNNVVKHHMGFYDAIANINVLPATISLAFGFTIGAFIKFYKDWTNYGDAEARMSKSVVISSLFAWLYAYMAAHGDIGHFNPFIWSGLLANLSLAANTAINQEAKDSLNEQFRLNEDAGLYRDGWESTFNKPLTRKPVLKQIQWMTRATLKIILQSRFGKWFTKDLRPSHFASQMWQLVSFTFKGADLTGVGVGPFPIGKTAYWLAPIWGSYWALKKGRKLFAEGKITRERLEGLEAAWDSDWKLKWVPKIPVNIVKATYFVGKTALKLPFVVGKIVVKTCASILTDKNP